MNNLEQIDLLVRAAAVLDGIKGPNGALDARDKILFLINSSLDQLIAPDSEEALGDPSLAVAVFDLRESVRRHLRERDPDGRLFSLRQDNRDQLVVDWKRAD